MVPISTLRNLESWQKTLAKYMPERIAPNARILERGRKLWLRDAAGVIHAGENELVAIVDGDTNAYRTGLLRDGPDQLRIACDCPSDKRPCKHMIALVLTILEADAYLLQTIAESIDEYMDPGFGQGDAYAGPSQPPDPVPPPIPGETIGTATVSEHDEQEPDALFEQDIDRLVNRLDNGVVIEQDGSFAPTAYAPAKSNANKTYKPAFLLSPDAGRDWNGAGEEAPVWSLRPALIYIRKNGSEGAVSNYSPTKPRLRAQTAPGEEFFRRILARPGRSTTAVAALEALRSSGQLAGSQGLLGLPVFVDDKPGYPPYRCKLSPLNALSIQWDMDAEHEESLALAVTAVMHPAGRPEHAENNAPSGESVTSESVAGDSVSGDSVTVGTATTGTADASDTLLIVPDVAHRAVWYLDGRSAGIEPLLIAAIRTVLRRGRDLTLSQARRLYELCTTHLAEQVHVAEPPIAFTLTDEIPVPVLAVKSAPGDTAIVSLHFRYGNEEVDVRSRRYYLPSAEPWSFYRRIISAEYDFRRVAGWIVDRAIEALLKREAGTGEDEERQAGERKAAPEPEPDHAPRGASGEAPASDSDSGHARPAYPPTPVRYPALDIEIDQPGEDLLFELAPEAIAAGFELRLNGRKARIASSTPKYRITGSGEGWLEAELGFSAGDRFVPLEQAPVRGTVRVGDTVYVFRSAEDIARYANLERRRRVSTDDLGALAELAELAEDPEHEAFESLRVLRERIAAFESMPATDPPAGLEAELRPYQREGLSWLWFLHEYSLGGCLADDMGLGKTLQTLACLLKARQEGQLRAALVVAPVTTLGNWRRECERFTPSLTTSLHAGPGRAKSRDEFANVDIVLVSYATLRMDINLFQSLELDYLVLDEAQAIKNPHSKTRREVRSLKVPHRLALSGTPIENNSIELWSMFDLLMPGMLGARRDFAKRYARPIEEQDDVNARDRLRRIIRPLLLRRRKRDVAPELPEREERDLFAEPEEKQLQVYETLRRNFKQSIEQRVENAGLDGARMHILEAMLRLRQAAILPVLVDEEYARVPSAKLELLEELIGTIAQEGNKALVFSQFVRVMDEVERRLGHVQGSTEAGAGGNRRLRSAGAGRSASGGPASGPGAGGSASARRAADPGAGAGTAIQQFRLDGSTPADERDRQIRAFQESEGAAVFLISLKAGGFGINLTAADYVILLDPWWNPAVESQAIDRAHRIGRDGTVIALRLITVGTIEEKMRRLQERKRALADSIIREDSGGMKGLTREDLEWLFGEEE